MTNPESGSPQPPLAAGLARRLAAMFYDLLLLFAIGWTVTAVAIVLHTASVGEAAVRATGQAAVSGPLLQAAIAGATVLFFGWFWTRSGQTLGMQAWRLRVECTDGSLIGWRQSVIRCLGACISALCLGAGYWWLLLDAEHRTWHDRWSNSRVVLLPRQR